MRRNALRCDGGQRRSIRRGLGAGPQGRGFCDPAGQTRERHHQHRGDGKQQHPDQGRSIRMVASLRRTTPENSAPTSGTAPGRS